MATFVEVSPALCVVAVKPFGRAETQVGLPEALPCKSVDVVPAAVDVGAFPAPPPMTTPYCVNAAEDVKAVPELN